VQDIADRVDSIARKLVQLMEATWDPPMAPQIEHEVSAYTTKLCRELLASAQQELKNQNVGGTFDSLDALRPWWPKIKDASGVSLELVGLFSKVHTCASQEFMQATKEGDSETAEAIRDFAKKFDALRPAFEGLPPPTEAEQRGLAATLEFSEAKATVEKQLGILDAEFAKTAGDDKAAQLSLAIMVQALEALVPVWATVFENDPSYSAQLQKTCGNIETWAVQASSGCPTKKADNLLKFAEAYDDRRVRLAPPEPEDGSLHRRIAEKAADAHLKAVERELAKETGLNPMALLEHLRSCSAAFQIDTGMEEVRGRLSFAFDATADRVAKTYAEALAASDGRREDMLQHFAMDFDQVWDTFKEVGKIESKAGLLSRLAEEREKLGSEQLAAISKALPEAGKTDIAALIQALSMLRFLWPKLPEASALPEQVASSLAPLEDHLDRVSQELAEQKSSDGASAADILLQQAAELDSIIPQVVPERHEDNLRSRVVSPAISAHVGAMEAAMREGSVDCAVLAKELPAVQVLVQEIGFSESARKQLLDFISALEAPLLARVADAGSAGAEAELRVAAAADETRSMVESGTGLASGPATLGLHKKLEGASGAAAKLGEMRVELAKPSGMNPKVVVQALQALEPLWSPVAEMEAFKERLIEALEQFHERLQEAGRKALGTEAKLKALMAFAEDADTRQQALVPLSPGLPVRSFCDSLSRLVADNQLKAAEAELAKESGMNPAHFLKNVVELSNTWPQIGKEDAGPSRDAILDLHKRVKEMNEKVHSRMQKSLEDALSAGNKKKEAALLNFAKEFDATYGLLQGEEPGDAGGLLSSLEAQVSSSHKD